MHGGLVVNKSLSSTLISVFLTGFRYFSYQVATQLSSRGWGGPRSRFYMPRKKLGYSQKSTRDVRDGSLHANHYTTEAAKYINISHYYSMLFYFTLFTAIIRPHLFYISNFINVMLQIKKSQLLVYLLTR